MILPSSGFQTHGVICQLSTLMFNPLTHLKYVYLKAAYNLPQWQRAFTAADESGGGQTEHFVQVGLR